MRPGRAALLALGGVSMLAGLNGALRLLGLPAPIDLERLAQLHGLLMVLGFLGTVIALERAAALRQPWGYAAPAGLGAGALLLLSPLPMLVGQLVTLAGATALVAVYGALWRRAHDAVVLAQLVAAAMVVAAVLVWMRADVPTVLVLLSGFIVVTIAAERVELARIALPASAGAVLLAGTAAVAVAGATSLLWPALGARLFGIVLAVSAMWLATHDVAVRTIRARGLPRFAAAGMLTGYAWLGVAAFGWIAGGAQPGWAYDTVVHAVFLGFAMSMVMAHAPVILPGVLGVRLPYRRLLWVPLVVLHVALVVRVSGSLLAAEPSGSGWFVAGAVGTIAAMLLLVAAAVTVGVLGRRPAGARGVGRTAPQRAEARP